MADSKPDSTRKNIVVCLDGTGNQIRASGNTNVIRLFRALENNAGRQILYYDPGVGTFSAAGAWTRTGRWFSRLLGRAFGVGMKTNLAEAYTFLMNHWEPDDKIYIFGFSRGAYTARALAGLLHTVGLPRPSSENLVQYAIATYARRRNWTDADRKEATEFARTVCRSVNGGFSIPVHYMGIWDTVSAPGIFRRDLLFENAGALENVVAGRHAISIDEKRRPYREFTVQNPRMEEAWFAGVHSDVGGGFEDAELSNISLMWVLKGACANDVELREFAELRELPTVVESDAMGAVHRMGRIWALATYRHRKPAPRAKVHDSVRVRISANPAYRPILRDPVWVDEDWCNHEVSNPPDESLAPRRHDTAGVGDIVLAEPVVDDLGRTQEAEDGSSQTRWNVNEHHRVDIEREGSTRYRGIL
ncbi:MAG: DUF2235 domain-containing protein [Pseudonocardia sp.]|nr:MAG: DUF2235 domain-containing protein [Pseudonocardia sp.]